MHKSKIHQLSVIALSIIPMGVLASEVKIINYTDSKAHVYFRGKGKTHHSIVTLAPKGMNESVSTHQVLREQVENAPLFEAIASTGSKGDPDWKLLAGTCANLEIDKNYTLLIEPSLQGLKTSCTVINKE